MKVGVYKRTVSALSANDRRGQNFNKLHETQKQKYRSNRG
jgi:hypothetical protein